MIAAWIVVVLSFIVLVYGYRLILDLQSTARERLRERGYNSDGTIRPSDIPWGEGKDLSNLLPSLGFEDTYKQTKMYELEKWWDKEHLPRDEYKRKYPVPRLIYQEPVRQKQYPQPLTAGAKSLLRDPDRWEVSSHELIQAFEKRFIEMEKKPPLILGADETISFIPKNRDDFVARMLADNETPNSLAALQSDMKRLMQDQYRLKDDAKRLRKEAEEWNSSF